MPTTLPELAQNLRKRAEEKFRSCEGSSPEIYSPVEYLQNIHNLGVHQIELEMQNEELHRTQRDLEALQLRYVDLYDLAPVGYLTLTEKGLIKEANLLLASLLGVKRDDLIRQPLYRFIVPEDQDVFYLHRNQIIEHNEVRSWEIRMVRADGSYFWADLQAKSAHNGECWITLNDISNRKQMQTLIENSTYQLTEAQRISHIGSWELDVRTNTSSLSDEVYHIFGIDPAQSSASYNVVMECIHPEDRQYKVDQYSRSVKENIPYNLIYRTFRKSDKELRYIHEQCTHMRTVDGSVIKSIGTFQDVTELVSKENALKEYANHVVQSIEQERLRIARELHDDLGQSLTLFSLTIAQLKRTYPIGEIPPALLDLNSGVHTMMESIRQICTSLRPALLDEVGLSAALESICREFITTTDINCTFESDGYNGECCHNGSSDCSMTILRVVQESLNNVIKHAAATAVSISLHKNDGTVSLDISDNGCGFSPEVCSDKKSFGLTGMRERAHSLGGTVDIISTPGKGTSVALRIPCQGREGIDAAFNS